MLSVEVGDRPEDVLDALVPRLATGLEDPFQAEWVSVPTLGFRSWLRFRLAERLGAGSGGDGIEANIEMPFPGALRLHLLDAHATAVGLGDQPDPWRPRSLVWRLMEVMARAGADIDPRLSRSGLPPGVSLAERAGPIADLFDRYDVHRPQMLAAWVEGHDVGPDGRSALDPERLWQPELYRALRRHVLSGQPGFLPPAERLVDALERARSGALPLTGGPTRLPPRLFVVGQSILAADLGPVLEALSTQIDVHVLLLSPSAATTHRLASRLAAEVARRTPAARPGASWASPREDAALPADTGHRLVHGWGARALDSALLLGTGGFVPDVLPPTAPEPATLLAHVQSEMRADTATPTPWPGGRDASVQVHSAPGRTRQVEVLRDVILGLLRDRPDLDEGDIAVVCPQLDAFAPVLASVLGPSAGRGEQPRPGALPSLRYTVVDRSAREVNPVLDAMAAVIDAVPGRFDTGTVGDLLHKPAVRERFGLTGDDLQFLSEVIEATGVRWGLDGPHRIPWGIDASHRANSWASGVDQLMMGIALGDDLRDAPVPGSGEDPHPYGEHAMAVGGIAPMVLEAGGIGSAGRLATALRTVAHVHDLLSEPPSRPITDWVLALTTVADLLVAPPGFELWQRAKLDSILAEVVGASGGHTGAPSDLPLTLADVRRLLTPDLDAARSRADLGHGSVVVAHPALLAGIPFRVVCVLGLDEGALPLGRPSGDDLGVLVPLVGDPDLRGEARAAILAAVGAARDHLVVTCTSRDVRTNLEVPRSVLLDELLEVVAASAPEATGELVHDHPRQAFDPGELDAGEGRTPFGFDPAALDGARSAAAREPRAAAPGTLLDEPLVEAPGEPVVELSALHAFYSHPVRAFFRRRLQVALPEKGEAGSDQLPIDLSGLEQYEIGTALVELGLAPGGPATVTADGSRVLDPRVQAVLDAHEARGTLPPPAAAGPVLDALAKEVDEVLRETRNREAIGEDWTDHDVDVELPSGQRLTGSVRALPSGPAAVRFARYKPSHRVAISLDLLALTAARPDQEWTAVLVTRAENGRAKVPTVGCTLRVGGADPEARRVAALAALDTLVTQWRDGLCYPLPLFDRTSHALAREGRSKAEPAWGSLDPSQPEYRSECRDPYHQLAFGPLRFDELEALDAGGHTLKSEARRLWDALDVLVEVEAGGAAR